MKMQSDRYVPDRHTLKRSICQAKDCKYFSMHYTRLPLGSTNPFAVNSQILLCGYHFRVFANMNMPEREAMQLQPQKKRWI